MYMFISIPKNEGIYSMQKVQEVSLTTAQNDNCSMVPNTGYPEGLYPEYTENGHILRVVGSVLTSA